MASPYTHAGSAELEGRPQPPAVLGRALHKSIGTLYVPEPCGLCGTDGTTVLMSMEDGAEIVLCDGCEHSSRVGGSNGGH